MKFLIFNQHFNSGQWKWWIKDFSYFFKKKRNVRYVGEKMEIIENWKVMGIYSIRRNFCLKTIQWALCTLKSKLRHEGEKSFVCQRIRPYWIEGGVAFLNKEKLK